MAIDFKELNKKYNVKGLQDDIKEAKENGGDFQYKEVPHGTYEVSVEKLEFQISKTGNPMVAIWWNILEGEYKNSKIFQYQVITQGFQIHLLNEFLRSMESGLDIEFIDYEQYSNLLLDIAEEIENLKLEYALSYGKNNKGFNIFEILEVYES